MIEVKKNPFSYRFKVKVALQSLEKDGEAYSRKLMDYFSKHDFEIMNAVWERESMTHNRLGHYNPHDIITIEINIERTVEGIHSPSDYINSVLHDEIYKIVEDFKRDGIPNDDKLDYITWISESWYAQESDSDTTRRNEKMSDKLKNHFQEKIRPNL